MTRQESVDLALRQRDRLAPATLPPKVEELALGPGAVSLRRFRDRDLGVGQHPYRCPHRAANDNSHQGQAHDRTQASGAAQPHRPSPYHG